MDRQNEYIRRAAAVERTASGEELWVLSLRESRSVASALGMSELEVELLALQDGIVPARYQRSIGTVGWDGQIKLLQAIVGIVGAGGLGGWVIEGLARMGLGTLVVIDRDTFADNNLNRQLLCTEANLGESKVDAASARVDRVNSAVRVVVHQRSVDEEQMVELLAGSEVVVDAVDSLPARLALQRAASRLGVPLVHGAIAGYVGQVMTIYPGDAGLLALYGNEPPEHGIETTWGNPAGTPMMTAAWQIQEVVKIVTGRGETLRNRMLFMDAEAGTVDVVALS